MVSALLLMLMTFVFSNPLEVVIPPKLTAVLSFHQQTAPTLMPGAGAHAVIYVLIVGLLVGVLMVGGTLIISLGLMSKRDEDHIGKRTPSDMGILKDQLWPEEKTPRRVFPAMEAGIADIPTPDPKPPRAA